MKKLFLCTTVIVISSLLFTSCFDSSKDNGNSSSTTSSSQVSSSSETEIKLSNKERMEIFDISFKEAKKLNLKPNECYFMKQSNVPVCIANPSLLTMDEFITYYDEFDLSVIPKKIAGKSLTYISTYLPITGDSGVYIYESDISAVPEGTEYDKVTTLDLANQPLTGINLFYMKDASDESAIKITISNTLKTSVSPKEDVKVEVSNKNYNLVSCDPAEDGNFFCYSYEGIKPISVSDGSIHDDTRLFSDDLTHTKDEMLKLIELIDITTFDKLAKLIQPLS